MSIKSIIGLTAASILLGSCQSNSYHINGFANQFQDGDTICLAMEEHLDEPFARTIVKDGKFLFSGETDSISPCHAFLKRDQDCGIMFFLEPKQITIEIHPLPTHSRVSGTTINNEWQALSDSIALMAREVVKLIKMPPRDNLSQEREAHSLDSLHRRMSECILNTAHRNSDNALGEYIRKKYKEPEFR